MNKEACGVFDKLSDLENALSKDQKLALFYIAGYIIRKDYDSSNDVLLNDTNFYYQKMAVLFKTMN